jgi:CRISPR-associated protein Csd1
MLSQLVEYSERLERPPVLYSPATVRYAILLDGDGRLLSPEPVEMSDPAAPRLKGRKLLVPQVQKTSGVRANLLNGNAEYTLGIGRETSKPDRVRDCHAAYLKLLRRCAEHTHEPAVQAILTFLEGDPRGQLQLPDDFAPDGVIVFRVDGVDPTELLAVQNFWKAENDPAAHDAPTMQCLICSHRRPVLRVLQQKVKGVPGGQTAGTSIISANSEAFLSYGLEGSLIAPTCAACAEGFTNGINDLLAHQESCVKLGGAAFIFWTREEVDFSPRATVIDGEPTAVRALRETIHSGKPVPKVQQTAFYASVLSGSGGRTVVREWIDQSVRETMEQVVRWFDDQWIVDEYGGEPRPFGLFILAAATVRDASADLAPPAIRSLLRAALTRTPVPLDFMARALRRAAAGTTVVRGRRIDRLSHPRAALIKLVLARHGMSREEVRPMTQLVADHPSPAYQCGRLLAVLDAVQRAALGSVNATVIDRYFGTASSAPGTVFPYLIRGSAPHLAKLRKARPGAYQALQLRLEEVMNRLPAEEFEPVLTLKDQGLFALGYYHQRADDRRRAREAAERKRSGPPGAPGASETDTGDLTEEDLQP